MSAIFAMLDFIGAEVDPKSQLFVIAVAYCLVVGIGVVVAVGRAVIGRKKPSSDAVAVVTEQPRAAA